MATIIHPGDSLQVIARKLARAKKTRSDELREVLQSSMRNGTAQAEGVISALEREQGMPRSHSLRVQAFALELGARCGYDNEQLSELSYGALLHDVGKFLVPECVVRAFGTLSDAEMRVMRQHTTRGYELLSSIPHLQEAARLALLHHERMDGKGYPLGLPGSEIPLSARICMLADSLDVMLAGRLYSPPRSVLEARIELIRCAGTQFDREVVDVFLQVPDADWLRIHSAFVRTTLATPATLLSSPAIPF